MTSTLLSVVPHGEQRQARPRSLSATDPPSPESISSDSHSSSDPDTHLSTISSWLPTPTAPGLKGFDMDVDGFSGHPIMEHSELTFESRMNEIHAVDPYSNYNVMHDNTPSNTKHDILMLEELIRDGVYDAASTPAPYLSYSPSIPLQTSAPPSIFAESFPCPFVPSQSSIESAPSHSALSSTTLNVTLPEPKHTPNQSDYFANDSSDATGSTPNSWDADQTTIKTEAQCSAQSSFDQVPSAVVSLVVVYPPKELCLGLPIVFPSIPLAGTKSRVETQIKLVLDLATPVSSSSQFSSNLSSRSSSVSDENSLTASPPVISLNLPDSELAKLAPTHDRVGTYSYLRLPYGTTTKRRPIATGGRRDSNSSDPENTLQVAADVVCCSTPTVAVQSCQSCQAREAKRTARKLAARVRPPSSTKKVKAKEKKKASKKVDDEEFDELPRMEEDEEEEPNVDASILQFNCGEILRFSSGSVTLPMRITCYCRHHKEKIGFQIVFTLTDYQGRIVGRGTTPPILITDDHKSNNAVSKLPPMHPLRQTLHPTPPARTVPLPMAIAESQHPVSLPTSEETARPYTRRREASETSQRRKRTKPYDGRPNRASGISPGIEGRQDVILALHPAHTRMQESRSQPGSTTATRSSTPISETRFILPSQSMNGLRNADCQSPHANLPLEMYPPSPTQSLVSPSGTAAQGQSTLLSQMDMQYLQSSSSSQPPTSIAAPIYSAMSFPTEMPKIHRLIPSSGPTTGGIEITVLGSHFHPSMSLECVFGGAVASSTHRWSDNTLVCVLPPRATPGLVAVAFKGIKHEGGRDEPACLFNYVDECDRQLMELALQVVGLKMTGKIEEARNVAMRIVGNTQSPNMTAGEVTQMNTLSDAPLLHHQLLGSLSGVDLETLTIKLLTLVDIPVDNSRCTSSDMHPINHKNATGQTLLHLAVLLALPSLVSCLIGRSIDLDAQNSNGLTALHFAAMAGWTEGVELLINGGVRTNIVDEMGLMPIDRARDAGFASLTEILDEHGPTDRSGDEGDDERWQSDREESEDAGSDTSPSRYSPAYHTHSRVASSTQVHEESSETESPTEPAPVSTIKSDIQLPSQDTKKQSRPNEKHDTTFVERLQRTLPQGILPNMQIPGFLQIQLPERAWGALPNIPVFPILVPLPNLPNWPWNDSNGSKKETGTSEEKQQQPSFATLWTAYDSIANNAWRAQWEKWTAHVTALQTANNNRDSAELPPYTPREDSQSEQVEPAPPDETVVPPVPTESRPSQSLTRSPLAKVKRRVGYGTVAIPETEVEAYHYKPTKRQRLKSKQDHMLVLFWIPILCVGFAYALYTILPLAFQLTKRLLPTLSRRI